MKHLFRFFNILLISLAAFVATLGGILAVNLFDSTIVGNQKIRDDNEQIADLLQRKAVSAFDSTVTDEKIKFTFDEYDLESLFNQLIQQINSNQSIPVKFNGVSVTNDKGKYTLQLSIEYYYKTVVSFGFNLVDEDEWIVLSFDKMEIGKLNLTNSLFSLAVGFISPDVVENAIAAIGVTAKVSWDDKQIKINRKDIANKLDAQIASLNNDFVTLAYELTLKNEEENIVNFDYGATNSELGLSVDLSKLKYDKEKHYALYNTDLNLNKQKELTYKIISDKELNVTYATSIFPFLVNGYNSLDEEKQKVIDSIEEGLSSYIGKKPKDYTGIITKTEDSIEKYVQDKDVFKTEYDTGETSGHPYAKGELNVPSSLLNQVITNKLDLKDALQMFVNEKNNKFIFMSIEQLSVYVGENVIGLDFVMSMNGLPIVIQLGFNAVPTEGYELKAKLDSLKLGSIDLKGTVKETIFNYLSKYINTDWIKFEHSDEGSYLTINIESVKDNETYKSLISFCETYLGGAPDPVCSFTSNGNINFKIEKSL